MKAPYKKPAEPKRARVDDGIEDPGQIAERIYTDAFLSELQKRFEIGSLPAEAVRQLRKIAARYILGRRLENQAHLLKGDQRKYSELQEATETYLALLKQREDCDLASDLANAAALADWPKPESNIPDRYYRQLVLLLELLSAGARQNVTRLASRGGQPKNFGLEYLVRLAADFWIEELARSFTVAYHQGEGLTPAFEFIKALVTPLDDVSDTQIVTAMRTEIAKRNSPGPPKVRRKLTRT